MSPSSKPAEPKRKPARPSPDLPPRAPYDDAARQQQRARQQLDMRIGELSRSHWLIYRCEGGHTTEVHRSSADGETTRCPTCGRPALREQPESTAIREQQAFAHPAAIIARTFEAIGNWAMFHLNSESWTQRSEQLRAAQERAAVNAANGGQWNLHDL